MREYAGEFIDVYFPPPHREQDRFVFVIRPQLLARLVEQGLHPGDGYTQPLRDLFITEMFQVGVQRGQDKDIPLVPC